MFYHSHPKLLHQKRIKCIVSCVAGGYILCVSAMMVLYTSQDLHKAPTSIEADTDVDVVQQKQSQLLHAGNPVDKDTLNEHGMSNRTMIQETFTAYKYDDNDGAVNTLPKPQVERYRNKAVGHRKVKRRRGPRYQTPPIVTNLDGFSVTGMACSERPVISVVHNHLFRINEGALC